MRPKPGLPANRLGFRFMRSSAEAHARRLGFYSVTTGHAGATERQVVGKLVIDRGDVVRGRARQGARRAEARHSGAH
jgi:hypothetical protein